MSDLVRNQEDWFSHDVAHIKTLPPGGCLSMPWGSIHVSKHLSNIWKTCLSLSLCNKMFFLFSSDRYSEQVIPLLVQAQRNLTEGVQELGGREPPQPHYQALMSKLNSVITAKHYLTQQLELVIDK